MADICAGGEDRGHIGQLRLLGSGVEYICCRICTPLLVEEEDDGISPQGYPYERLATFPGERQRERSLVTEGW